MSKFDPKRYAIIQAQKRKNFRESSNADEEISKVDFERYKTDKSYSKDVDFLLDRSATEKNSKPFGWTNGINPVITENEEWQRKLEEKRKYRS